MGGRRDTAGDLGGFREPLAGHQHARRRVAGLAGVLEHVPRTRCHGLLEIGVVEDDVGRLAAQLLRDALDGRGGVLRNGDAGTSGPGERDHGDVRMLAERGPDARAVAVDEVEDAGRHAGLVEDLGEDHRVERRDLARLQHHRAAGGERRRDLDGDLVDRPVPGGDQRADADWFPHDAGRPCLFLEGVVLQGIERGLDVLRSARRLCVLRQPPGRAHLVHDGLGDLVVSTRKNLEDALQELHAFTTRALREAVECARRCRDRGIDVRRRAEADTPVYLLGGRIDDVHGARFDRVDPAPVDVELEFFEHESAPRTRRA